MNLMAQENNYIKTTNWKPLILAGAILIACVFGYIYYLGYNTKQKLMNGRWKLTYMEMDDAVSKRAFELSQRNSEPDFAVGEIDGLLNVTFLPDTLVFGCEVKAKAIEGHDGQIIFKIIAVSDDKLELEQMIFMHGGPFGAYRVMGRGKRLSFINLNKQQFQPSFMDTSYVENSSASKALLDSIRYKNKSIEQLNREFDDLIEKSTGHNSDEQMKSTKTRYTYFVCIALWGDPDDKFSSFGGGKYVSNVVGIESRSSDKLAQMRDNAESQVRSRLHDKDKLRLTCILGDTYNSYEEASSAMHAELSDKNTETFTYDGYFHSVE